MNTQDIEQAKESACQDWHDRRDKNTEGERIY